MRTKNTRGGSCNDGAPIPDSRGPIIACGYKPAAICAKGDTADLVIVAAENPCLDGGVRCIHVPKTCLLVSSSRDQPAPVGAERDTMNFAEMSAQQLRTAG